nr:hypothetical protein BaRGS_021032 [Batillaria attramentaria]
MYFSQMQTSAVVLLLFVLPFLPDTEAGPISGSKGLKRAADVLVADEALLAALTEACPDFDVGPDAPLSVVVEDAFRQVDDVLDYCAQLGKTQ